jgi:hypothetical protein
VIREFGQDDHASQEFDDMVLNGYSGEVTVDFGLTAGTIETPKEDPRIGSRVLHKHFKSITLGKRLYSRISRSLDKLGVKK